jgi:fucose permease
MSQQLDLQLELELQQPPSTNTATPATACSESLFSTTTHDDIGNITSSVTRNDEKFVYQNDIDLIVPSVLCFLSFLAYGSSCSSLGPALPFLSERLGVSVARLAMLFTARGIGYTVGTLLAAAIGHYGKDLFGKDSLNCLALAVSGATFLVLSLSKNFFVALVCFLFQGIGYGGMDTFANCFFPEIWGKRVQPWMQALHTCFGIGSIFGPLLIGNSGLFISYFLFSWLCFLPGVGLTIWKLFPTKSVGGDSNYNQLDPQCKETADTAESIPKSPVFENLRQPPITLRIAVALFLFVYVGLIVGFQGWISTYTLETHMTSSNVAAAYLTSIFNMSLTTGRFISIVVAIYLSPTGIIRMEIVSLIISTILAVLFLDISYMFTAIITCLMAISLCAVYPVMLNIIGDYGYQL